MPVPFISLRCTKFAAGVVIAGAVVNVLFAEMDARPIPMRVCAQLAVVMFAFASLSFALLNAAVYLVPAVATGFVESMPAYTATVRPPLPVDQVACTVLLKSVAVARDHQLSCLPVVELFSAVNVFAIVTAFTVGAVNVPVPAIATWAMIRSPNWTVAGSVAVPGLVPVTVSLTKPRLAIGSIVYGSGSERSSSDSVSSEPFL